MTTQSQQIKHLEKLIAKHPSDVNLARHLWRLVGSTEDGYDMRSNTRAVSTFRPAMLASPEGVVAFAAAMRDLYEETTEPPRIEALDSELLQAIGHTRSIAIGADKELLDWLCGQYGF